MASAQSYVNTKLVMDALGLPGDEPGLYGRCREASQNLQGLIGAFLPTTGSKTFYALEYERGVEHEFVFVIDPLLALTAITDENGAAIASTSYALRPVNKAWDNGPYLRIECDYDEINITGRWGLYEELASSGISGSLAATSTASLVVTNGGLLWPGQVIKMGDEQILITAGCGSENSPSPSLLTGSVTTGYVNETLDVIPVTSGTVFFANEVVRMGDEDMLIRRIVSNTLVVQRGWNGTQRDEHSLGTQIYVYRTVTVERGMNGSTAAIQSAVTIYKAVIPTDVAYLATQMAALIRGKAQTGFTGRGGNETAGESFYLSEFPRSVIKAVKENYSWRA